MYARGRNDVVTIPTIRIAFVLSILVHAVLLWLVWPHLRSLTEATGRQSTSLAVDLAPRRDRIASAAAPAPPAPPATVAEAPASRASAPARPPPAVHVPVPRKPKPAPRPVSPPVIAQQAPSSAAIERPSPVPPRAPAPEPSPAVATPMPPPPAQDLASYVEAQRLARGEASPPSPAANTGATSAEREIARRDQIVAANLGLNKTPSFGTDARNAGGLFQITELNYDDARFYFFGFDKAIGRNARQLIDVRRGSDPDIRIAIVRRMIAIIRDSINGDFVWVSQRTGNGVTLSSRPADNAGLEAFIMHDIFPEVRQQP